MGREIYRETSRDIFHLSQKEFEKDLTRARERERDPTGVKGEEETDLPRVRQKEISRLPSKKEVESQSEGDLARVREV